MLNDLRTKCALLIFFITIIVYSNSLGGAFVYDDEYFVVKNVHIRSLANIPAFFTNPGAIAFSQLAEDVYRPITTFSYALDYAVNKLNVFGYHLTNIILHGLNGVLLFFLAMLILDDILIALFAGLFFACHPIQTEVVSWISGRSSILFLFFYLGAFILYVLSRRREDSRFYGYSLACFAMSLFSKEMAVTLPVLLISYDIHFKEKGSLRDKIVRYIPYFVLAGLFVIMRAMVLGRVSQCSWWGGSPYYTFLTMLKVMVGYIGLLIAPIRLCAYRIIPITQSFADTEVVASFVLLAAIIIAIPFVYKRSRPLSFALLWFFITILPVTNIVPLKALMAERFLYIPCIGFCIAIALCLKRARLIAVVAAIAVVIAYASMTMARNEEWNSPIAISKSIIEREPLNPWGYASLGAAYSGSEQYKKAIVPLLKSIALSRDYAAPRNILGACYLQLGRYDEAIVELTRVLELDPRNVEAMNSLGVAYGSKDQYEEAIKVFEKEVDVDPAFVSARLNLGAAYERFKRSDDALKQYEAIVQKTKSPQDVGLAYIRMGDVYYKSALAPDAAGKEELLQKARSLYEKAIAACGTGFDDLRKVAVDRLKKTW